MLRKQKNCIAGRLSFPTSFWLMDTLPEKKYNKVFKIKLFKTKNGEWFGAETSLDVTFC